MIAIRRLFANRHAPTIVLVLATLVWGASFVITRAAVQGVSPLIFVACRFMTASAAVTLLTRPALHRLSAIEMRAGLALGVAMLGGYTLQAIAMHRGIDSGRAAFISALYVPVVPVLQLLVLRRMPGRHVWIGLGLACAGLVLMAGRQSGSAAGPQLLVLAGAFAIAAEILLVGVFAGRTDPRRLAIAECFVLSVLCLALSLATGTALPPLRAPWVLAALGLGCASACLQIAVNWAQRSVNPARATLIYTMEPVWAGLFGALAGERMGTMALVGAALILGSVIVSAER